MAGIGFELRKLFKNDSVISKVMGTMYATVVTVGPTVLVIVALNVMYMLLPYVEVSYADKEVLSATILYVFIFSLILTSPINIILSRYVADKIYQEDLESIAAAVETGAGIVAVFVGVLGIPFGYLMYTKGELPLHYVFASYVFFAGLSLTFYFMTFITALKEYMKITYSFFASLAFGIVLAVVLVNVFGVSVVYSILYALAVSFSCIAVFLFVFIRKSFVTYNKNHTELLRYIKEYRWLLYANGLYTWALYIHNFVFWFFSDYKVVVANVFISAPTYDVATYIAMLSNISILVIFVVNVETKFHEAYKEYCESIIGAAGKDIVKTKEKMIEVLRRELLYIIQIQLIINIAIFLLAMIYFPNFGIDGIVLLMYPVLTVGYFLIYLVQCMMIFLFYLDDKKGAPLVSLVLFAGTMIGSFFMVDKNPVYTGMGTVIGGLLGFTVAFFRIRYKTKNLDKHIYCRGSIVRKRKKTQGVSNVRIYNHPGEEKKEK